MCPSGMVSLSLTLRFLLLSHLFLSSSQFNQRLHHTRNFKNEGNFSVYILLRYGPLLVCPDVHQMQNEGSNGGHSCEQDLKKQGKSQKGLSVVGSGDEANQTLSTIVISNGETPEPNRTDNDSKDERQ
ncbi:hypothetical protein Ddye_002061 [Dipteronia dyeriana]|uniref:Secreted protein n=1 Tax=Dipteronia dyeriana TaxID=168575 RepID=A0AAD9XQ87_9ROSI|nr:hypothetical protein Ddye_002061 [Dipteronia dyeriana]